MAKKKVPEWKSETSLADLLKRPPTGPRFCFVTDLHARAQAPKMRADDFRAALLEKLAWVMDSALLLGAEQKLICGGDLFDRFDVSLEVADEIIDLLEARGFTMASVFGNHDLNSSLSTAPRTVLGHLMRRSPGVIHPLPMLTSQNTEEIAGCLIWGHHYKYQNYLDCIEVPLLDISNPNLADRPRIVVSHSMILKDKPVFDDYVLFEDVQTNADMILLGHYHPMQAMTKLSNSSGTLIGGPGAMMRGALSRDDLTRKASMAVVEHNLTTHELIVDFVPIECARPAAEVFKLEEAQAEQRKNESLDSFRIDLENLTVQKLNVAGIIEELVKADAIPEDVRNEALRRIGVT